MTLSRKRFLSAAFTASCSLLLILGAGCGDQNEAAEGGEGAAMAPAGTSAGTGSGGGSGRLVIKGSDTLLPLSQQWAEEFQKKNPKAQVTVTGGGSGTGITALINGAADIANSSRPIKDKEKKMSADKGMDVKETSVARDGITIVVHPSNPIKSLTLEQLKGIYTGKINNWSELGGPDRKIVPSGRDTSSGTYAYFQEDVLGDEKYRADMISTPSNNQIANNVASQDGGIGYIGVAYATEFTEAGKVKEIPVAFKAGEEPVLPTKENILTGKYPISRALFNYTNGEPSGIVKDYLDYVTGPEGQQIVDKVGYVRLK